MKTITPTAIALNRTVIDGPMLNAAPGFRDTVSFTKPPSSRTGGRSDRVATTIVLVVMSAASTATATASSAPTLRRGLLAACPRWLPAPSSLGDRAA